MQNFVLIGHGNVGKEIETLLRENSLSPSYVVKSTGVYSAGSRVDDSENYEKYLNNQSAVFVSLPSRGDGSEMLHYYRNALELGALVITCEKAVIANHWELVTSYPEALCYSATVGGNSGILPAIRNYKDEIKEIRAVVNGTLNYISQGLREDRSKDDLYQDVLGRGFAEPGSADFGEVILNELTDVAYKVAILANHSGLLSKTLTPPDVSVRGYKEKSACAVLISHGQLDAGFLDFDDTSWFPKGVDNVLYINDAKVCEGAGAGGRSTALRMFKDFQEWHGIR